MSAVADVSANQRSIDIDAVIPLPALMKRIISAGCFKQVKTPDGPDTSSPVPSAIFSINQFDTISP